MTISATDLDFDKHQLIDIREDYERIDFQHKKSLHIPMGVLLEKASALDKDTLFVVHCENGVRSLNIVTMMQAKGFKNFISLEGGATALKNL